MCSLAPPRNSKTATTPDRNVVERSNQNSIVCLITTYKSHADTPDLNPTRSAQIVLKCVIFCNLFKVLVTWLTGTRQDLTNGGEMLLCKSFNNEHMPTQIQARASTQTHILKN